MVVGVLGGGQLGRMLALAGIPLGLAFRFFEPGDPSPVVPLGQVTRGDWQDAAALETFASGLDVCTYEVENVPVAAAERVAALAPLRPPVAALACGRDRFEEKRLFERLGIATPAWAPVTEASDLAAAARAVGLPLVLKARSLGYDGRGIAVVLSQPDLEPAWDRLGRVPVVAETHLGFDRELSALVTRGLDATEAAYPVVENTHVQGMLRATRAPAPGLPARLAQEAQEWALRIARELDHAGVLALELFLSGGRLLANEIAPRVHNSGHWTIDAAETSQFENHLRAILGLPLGSTEQTAAAVMLNLVGDVPDPASVLREGTHLHVYGKRPRPGRKVGHVTVTAPDEEALDRRLAALRLAWP